MAQAEHVTSAIGALIIGASAKPSTSPVCAAHAAPRLIPVDADAIDLEDPTDHSNKVVNTLLVYATAILNDTAHNVPSRVDLPHIDALLSDLAFDVTRAL